MIVKQGVLLAGAVVAAVLFGVFHLQAEETLTDGATVITSERMTYDYRRSIAVFENDVVVRDPEVRIESDRLNVLMTGTNSVRSVTAAGSVQLWQGDKKASCDKAVYVARTGEVIMHGNAVIELGEDKRLFGREIMFNIYEDKITCVPATLIMDSSSGGGAIGGLGEALSGPGRSGGRD